MLIAKAGSPSTLDELKTMPLSLLQDRRSGRGWPWVFPNEESLIPEQPGFTCDDPETELEMVLQGVVFAQIPLYLAERHLSQGSLVEVLKENAPQPLDLVLYRTRPGPPPQRIRLVYDFLLDRLSDRSLFLVKSQSSQGSLKT